MLDARALAFAGIAAIVTPRVTRDRWRRAEGHQDRLDVLAEVASAAAGDLAARLVEALREDLEVRADLLLAGRDRAG